jgi:hypothetical protein
MIIRNPAANVSFLWLLVLMLVSFYLVLITPVIFGDPVCMSFDEFYIM